MAAHMHLNQLKYVYTLVVFSSFLAVLPMGDASRLKKTLVHTGALAQALPEDGVLMALDKDARSMTVARKYFDAAGVGHKVSLVLNIRRWTTKDRRLGTRLEGGKI